MAQASAKRIGVVGSINMDLVVQVDTVPRPGETVIGSGFFRAPGGKGANQAVAASRAGGGDVVMFGAVGTDDFGTALTDNLTRVGVRVDRVTSIDGTPTGTAFIMLDAAGENRIVVVPGANGRYTPDLLDPAVDDLRACDALCASLEIPIETVARAVETASEWGVMIIVDPAPARLLPHEVLDNVDVLTPNLEEARSLLRLVTGEEPRPDADPAALAERLAGLGVPHVVVTLGSEGVVYRGEAGGFALAAYQVHTVDSVGAGDTFAGALAVRLAAGDGIGEAAEFANAAAALATTRYGAQQSAPSVSEIRRLMRS